MSYAALAPNGLLVNLKIGQPTLITLDEISHFAAADKYGEIHLRDGKVVLIHYAITRIAEAFADQFIMIKRDTVVRRSEILDYRRVKDTANILAVMTGGREFAMSRRHAREVRKMLQARMMAKHSWTSKEHTL
jgi:Response regulator of the LytR/AlgR family